VSVFEHHDYKRFFKEWVNSEPGGGRGLLSRLAEDLSISPAMLSHVFKGDKHLSLEMAVEVASFIGLNSDETDYFLLLVNFGRAGSHKLRENLKEKVASEQKKANELSKKVRPLKEISEIAQATFYSSWTYSGIRNLTACPGLQTTDAIAKHLGFSRGSVQLILDFLVKNGLCIEEKPLIKPGPARTHIGSNSVLVNQHHTNWRLQSVRSMTEKKDQNIYFTGPMSLSAETAQMIRLRIPSFIDEIIKLVEPSPSETVRCLNPDWFEY
jgi:uncharacterized protein (TIGR02147 family)